MRIKLRLAVASCLVVMLLAGTLTLRAAAARIQRQQVTVGFIELTLELPEYSISEEQGRHLIDVEGFSTLAIPYSPMLPHRLYDVLLPPDVVPESLELEIVGLESEILPGGYDIRLAPIPVPDQRQGVSPASEAETLPSKGRFPPACATLLSYSQMREWKFVRLDFTPFQYDIESRQLKVTNRAAVRITYARAQAEMSSTAIRHQVMKDLAPKTFINYDSASSWYLAADQGALREAGYDYVIITSNATVDNSAKLSTFVAHKQAIGHSVLVVTEDQFGVLVGQAPNHRAEKIRQWLMNNYLTYGIEYVLLIGDPSPYESGEGDIPMKKCWPRLGSDFEPDYVDAPTDYFYADLTGDWDYDDDGYYGEWSDDYSGVTGGVDLTADVYVGRIPVYYGDYDALDGILQKMIDYGSEAGDTNWRKNILLPMSFSDTDYDGAPLAEQMRDDYLSSAGYSSWRQYQQGNGACSLDSLYTSEEELRGGTVVRSRWASNDYGVVCWWGHGADRSASVGCDECWDGTLFSTSYASSLDDDHPSFTYQCSCLNGYPEYSNNLQYAVLKNGGVGTVGATRVSWYSTGVGYGEFDGSTTNSGIGYEYVSRLVEGKPAAEALYLAKSSMTPFGSHGDCWLMNLYDFNLYGDPALGIEPPCIDAHEPNDTSGQAKSISYGTTVTDGRICPPGDVDYFWFVGSGGDNIVVDIDAEAIGSYLDSYLELYASDGVTELADNDDWGGSLDSRLEYTLPVTGTYYLKVREYDDPNEGGPEYSYRMSLWSWKHRVYVPLAMKQY